MKEGCFRRKYVNLYSTTRIKLRPGQRMSGVWFQARARGFVLRVWICLQP